MSESVLKARVGEILESGKGETAGGIRFLPLLALESGTRVAVDRDLRWIAVPPDDRRPFVHGPGAEHVLTEVLESPRNDFDGRLEEAARALGLDALELVFAFPAVELVRAVLTARSTYLMRLALGWIRPSEARELRSELRRVAAAPELPAPVKDLAGRLVVPD